MRSRAREMARLGYCILAFGLFLQSCRDKQISWSGMNEQIRKEFPDVKQVSIDEYEKAFADTCLLVDVREKKEYAVSHIEHAVNLQDPSEVVARFRESGKDSLVLYCSVGYRSSEMAQRIQRTVKIPVYNLEGSIFAWANAGKPVYRDGKQVEVVHPYNKEWARLLDQRYWSDREEKGD